MMKRGPLNEDLMTDAEVRRLLDVSRTTLWRLRKEADLPFGRAGHKYLYHKSEILQWIKSNQAQHAAQRVTADRRVMKPSVSRKSVSAPFLVADGSEPYEKRVPETESGTSKPKNRPDPPRDFHVTSLGKIILGDSLDVLWTLPEHSVDLIMTSPPFGLVRKKAYGNADAHEYLEWFRPFGKAFKHVLKENGSLVIDLGGAWVSGQPTRSLYHLKLPIMLCEEIGFHLAQEFYWWNPSKLPTPAEWVTVRRVRVKDAMNCVWWLSPTPWPRASNKRVLQPYSDSMMGLLKNGYTPKLRPSGHDISDKFGRDNGAAIPPNLIAMANTESNGQYQRYCNERKLTPHPARFPAALPEYFIRMLTDPGDLVVDPFAGSCVTGEVAERLGRQWRCIELEEPYLKGALVRFRKRPGTQLRLDAVGRRVLDEERNYYKIPRPGLMWNGAVEPPLAADGGRTRRAGTVREPAKAASQTVTPSRTRRKRQPASS